MPTKKRRRALLIAKPELDREAPKNVRVTYFVLQTFTGDGEGVSIDEPFQPNDGGHARRLFDKFKQVKAGVVMFSRTGDPSTGDWDDAVIIDQAGMMPSTFSDIMAS